MVELIRSKLSLRISSVLEKEYIDCIGDLSHHNQVKSMQYYMQHGNTTCLEHSLYVSYLSYRWCKKLGFDYCSAARGGLLHDFFLYDWHSNEKARRGLHGFVHSEIALNNANTYFNLNSIEKDIIAKHMWPLTLKLPKYKESYIVLIVDKCCAIAETINLMDKLNVDELNIFRIT